jgi:hypothetical protein
MLDPQLDPRKGVTTSKNNEKAKTNQDVAALGDSSMKIAISTTSFIIINKREVGAGALSAFAQESWHLMIRENEINRPGQQAFLQATTVIVLVSMAGESEQEYCSLSKRVRKRTN